MNDRPAGPSRLLRGGRVLARLLVVGVLAVVALRLLESALTGFELQYWWNPLVLAAAFALISAVLWPLVLRVAIPVAMFTLGIGSFVLIGAALLGLSFALPGVRIAGIGTGIGVALALAAVGAVSSSLLAVDEDEIFFRRTARRARRAGGDPGGEQPPGVLFLQVDGLAYEVARRAVRDGDMPSLAAWITAGTHALTGWHTDWSSQTGASVCGILHGRNEDILGFRWYEKPAEPGGTGREFYCGTPEHAAEIERRHADGRGLLAVDGASRGNLFTGDAPHLSVTMSAVPLLTGSGRRGRRSGDGVGAGYYAYFANPVNVVRTFVAALVDIGRELSAATKQRRADVRPRVRRGGFYPFARAGTSVIIRDVVVSAIIEDMLAGRACVYADFLGYDEVAHHSGVERFDSLHVLRQIDRQLGRLHRATQLAPRRYHVVVLSDHGQTQGEPFTDRFGESIEELVARLCAGPAADGSHAASGTRTKAARRPAEGGWQATAALAEVSSGGGAIARGLEERVRRAAVPPSPAGAGHEVVTCASGHMALVSFPDLPGRVPLETIEREFPRLLPALVDHPGVGFVLVRSAESGPVVLGRDGVHRLATGVVDGTDPLSGYGPHAADLVRRFDGFGNCADVVVNSRYDPATDDASPFEPHVGSHGGMGGPQSRGFLAHPTDLPSPQEVLGGEIVGAEALHRVLRAWLTHLGHPLPPAAPNAEAVVSTRE